MFAYLHRANSFFAGKPKVSSTLSLYTLLDHRCLETQPQESLLTTTTPLALTTDSLNHEDPRVGGGPDPVLGGGRRAVRWRRL